MRRTKVEFSDSAGANKLAGRLDEPDGEADAYAIFAHCFTCSKDVLAASRIAGALVAQGVGVLRFDFTGLGSSEGDFSNTNFSSNVADLVAAAEHLRTIRRAPEILIGHSLGGAAVIAAAHQLAEVRIVVTIGAPSDPSHVRHLFAKQTAEIEQRGEARVQLNGRAFTIRRDFLRDVEQHTLSDKLASLGKALLVCHAPDDQIVAIENGEAIFAAARQPKSFVALNGADHMLGNARDALYVADVIAAWSRRHLARAAAAPAPAREVPGVLVEDLGQGPYTQRITARGHSALADEPESRRGQDRGMAPHEYILAGLGACSAITLRLYAERKGWTLGQVSVALDLRRVPGPTTDRKIEQIDKVISASAPLTAEQRDRLVEIADKCPMHKLLMSQDKVIKSRFAEEG